jgi:hypothetical protein
MKFIWRGNWRKGEIVVEAETLEELNNVLDELLPLMEVQATSQVSNEEFPLLPSGLGCSDAIKTLLQSKWGKQPRTMAEVKEVLEANALHFTKGTLSGTLTSMTKRGHLGRVKKAGKWAYVVK